MKMVKRGSVEISFNMIFSIILIIVFIAAAFYVIPKIIGLFRCAETGSFYQDLQDKVSKAWKSDATSELWATTLPTSIQYACFVNWSNSARGVNSELYNDITLFRKNIVLWPSSKVCSGLEGKNLQYLNLQQITSVNNPFCIKVVNGKASLRIEKSINENSVTIKNA